MDRRPSETDAMADTSGAADKLRRIRIPTVCIRSVASCEKKKDSFHLAWLD